MTLSRIGLLLIAVAGTVIPFAVAESILSRIYPPVVTGIAPPLWLSLLLYGLAFVIGLTVLFWCYKQLSKSHQPTDKADGLDEREDLPY